MKVPADIDALMWQIAEAEDPAAINEFKSKFPSYGSELDKRVFAVSGLKGSRPVSPPPRRERFMPSQRVVASSPAIPTWALFLVGVAVLSSVVFATYGTIRFLDSQKAPVSKIAVNDGNQGTPSTSSEKPGAGTQLPQNTNPNTSGGSPQNVPIQAQQPPDPFDRPVTLVSSQVELKTALADIAAQANVILEMPPDFPNPMIQIDYREIPAKRVLEDMGNSFGFSTFEQTPGTALLIPAVGSKAMDQGAGGGRPGFSGPIGNSAEGPNRKTGAILELPGR